MSITDLAGTHSPDHRSHSGVSTAAHSVVGRGARSPSVGREGLLPVPDALRIGRGRRPSRFCPQSIATYRSSVFGVGQGVSVSVRSVSVAFCYLAGRPTVTWMRSPDSSKRLLVGVTG